MGKNTQVYNTRQTMLTNDYEIFHYSDTGLGKVSLHHHDFYECYYFISGDVTYMIEGKSYQLMPGDIILINSKELHQPIIHNREVPYERIVIWLNKNFLNTLCTETADLKRCFEDSGKENVIRADATAQQGIRSILSKLQKLGNYSGMGLELLYRAYITELLILLNNLLFFNTERYNISFEKSSLIEEIIDYINSHLEETITIEDLSRQFYLSRFHLLREFKKYSGTTLHKFIVQKKLILAKELILQDIPITQVYEQCGFGDYSNFFRAFKNEYGVTPKQFFQLMRRAGKPEAE
ncbi:MAG TPA: AraC family transcriptional regulator [Clostridiales bacterium]|nr:AraC family transcriptional regulator [Clostridiales bacterium]